MAITTTSVAADTVPTVLEEARYVEMTQCPMRGLVWNIPKKLHEGSTVNVPLWGTVAAQSLTEGEDLANPQSLTDSLTTITPSEVGAQIFLTDKLVRDNQEDVKRAAGKVLGQAMAIKMDSDLVDLLDNAQQSPASSGSALALGHIAAARAILEGVSRSNGGPAPKPYVVVMHPYQLLDLVDILTPLSPSGSQEAGVTPVDVANDWLRNYFEGKVFGMPVYTDGNITIDASSDAKGGVFASGRHSALILSVAKEVETALERDESLRGTEMNIIGEYGVGSYNTYWMVELYSDATTPA